MNIEIETTGGLCEDTINIVRSNGKIQQINTNKSYSDAVDIDFSNLIINQININESQKLLKQLPLIDAFTVKKTTEFYKFLVEFLTFLSPIGMSLSWGFITVRHLLANDGGVRLGDLLGSIEIPMTRAPAGSLPREYGLVYIREMHLPLGASARFPTPLQKWELLRCKP